MHANPLAPLISRDEVFDYVKVLNWIPSVLNYFKNELVSVSWAVVGLGCGGGARSSWVEVKTSCI